MAGLSPRQRAEKTLKILEELGGLAELEERDGRLYDRGFGRPFSQAVCEHPKLCVVAEALVGELLGRPGRVPTRRAAEVLLRRGLTRDSGSSD